MKTNKTRFAAVVRVSTDKQKEKGASIQTQTEQIEGYVKALGGVVSCWYKGQEHATAGYEREMFNQLLKDSGKNLFDATIVCESSRWSRDNRKSKDGLDILLENGIRFFVGTTEYDLSKANDYFHIGMSTEMNEYQARLFKEKSRDGKITKAQMGQPSHNDKLPYGRKCPKGTNDWSIDKEKQKKIIGAVERYLNGEGIRAIAKDFGMAHANLLKIFRDQLGDTWTLFRKMKEPVKIKVPRLVSKQIEDAVHAQIKFNKTYRQGHTKHKYLLNGRLLCVPCGKALSGYTKPNGQQYYRHADKIYRHQCEVKRHVPAELLEKAVLGKLFEMYGNRAEMERAMRKAIPNEEENQKLRQRKSGLEKDNKNVQKKRERYQDLYADGLIKTKARLREKLSVLDEREALNNSEIGEINSQLENVPSAEAIKSKARFWMWYQKKKFPSRKVSLEELENKAINVTKKTIEIIYKSNTKIKEMTYEDKERLMQEAFGKKSLKRGRMAVHMGRPNEDNQPFTIEGEFGNIEGTLNLDAEHFDRMRNDPYRDDYVPELDDIDEGKKKVKHPTMRRKISSKDEGVLSIVSAHQHYFCRKCNRACCP